MRVIKALCCVEARFTSHKSLFNSTETFYQLFSQISSTQKARKL